MITKKTFRIDDKACSIQQQTFVLDSDFRKTFPRGRNRSNIVGKALNLLLPIMPNSRIRQGREISILRVALISGYTVRTRSSHTQVRPSRSHATSRATASRFLRPHFPPFGIRRLWHGRGDANERTARIPLGVSDITKGQDVAPLKSRGNRPPERRRDGGSVPFWK